MAGSINKVILVGNLGKDPEIRYSQEGGKIATFSIATSETWKDKSTGERKDNTQWHRVVVFNDNLSEVVEKYIKKGTKVYIEGNLQYRKYTDKDGIERHLAEIVLSRFRGELQILDSKRDGGDDAYASFDPLSPEERNNPPSSKPKEDHSKKRNDLDNMELDDDIPF